MVPVELPLDSSSVLTTVAPRVLPPETAPVNFAFGDTMTVSAKPGCAGSNAKLVPKMLHVWSTNAFQANRFNAFRKPHKCRLHVLWQG